MASPSHNEEDEGTSRRALWLPAQSMVSFENEGEEEYEAGACVQAPAKKRRLSAKQVEYLERSFEAENKLEPERKGQLAGELGLQPRQVAIWFQNRRARFKTKQLEKDFGALRASLDSLKADYDLLLKHNNALQLQVDSLKEKLVNEEGEKKDELCLKSETGNGDRLPEKPPTAKTSSSNYEPKQEDASSASAKSDVVDSQESPRCAENNYLAAAELSDFSQDESDALPFLSEPPASCCHLGFGVEDNPFNFWRF